MLRKFKNLTHEYSWPYRQAISYLEAMDEQLVLKALSLLPEPCSQSLLMQALPVQINQNTITKELREMRDAAMRDRQSLEEAVSSELAELRAIKARAVVSAQVPPDFTLQKPPAAAGEAAPRGGDASGGAALEEEDGPIPKLAGKRAQAHDIDLDLDLLDAEPAAAPPRARPLAGASTARSGDSSALAPTGQRLSLKDYKSRIEEHV